MIYWLSNDWKQNFDELSFFISDLSSSNLRDDLNFGRLVDNCYTKLENIIISNLQKYLIKRMYLLSFTFYLLYV